MDENIYFIKLFKIFKLDLSVSLCIEYDAKTDLETFHVTNCTLGTCDSFTDYKKFEAIIDGYPTPFLGYETWCYTYDTGDHSYHVDLCFDYVSGKVSHHIIDKNDKKLQKMTKAREEAVLLHVSSFHDELFNEFERIIERYSQCQH